MSQVYLNSPLTHMLKAGNSETWKGWATIALSCIIFILMWRSCNSDPSFPAFQIPFVNRGNSDKFVVTELILGSSREIYDEPNKFTCVKSGSTVVLPLFYGRFGTEGKYNIGVVDQLSAEPKQWLSLTFHEMRVLAESETGKVVIDRNGNLLVVDL